MGYYGKGLVAPASGGSVPKDKIENATGFATDPILKGDLVYHQTAYSLKTPLVEITNIDIQPTDMGSTNGLAWDPTDTYLVVTQVTTPFINIYKRDGDTFTRLPDPDVIPTATATKPSFDNTGTYLAVPQTTTPFINIYKRDGDTFTRLPDPATLPAGNGTASAFDPTGTYLAVRHFSSPYIRIYKRDGDTFTAIPDVPTSSLTGVDVGWDPTGRILIPAKNSGTDSFYVRTDDTFEYLSAFDVPVDIKAYSINWEKSGNYFAVTCNRSPGINVYRLEECKCFKLADPAVKPSGPYTSAWTNNGKDLLVSSTSSPFLYAYRRTEDALVNLDITLPAIDAGPVVMKFDSSGKYLATILTTAPYVRIYTTTLEDSVTPIKKIVNTAIPNLPDVKFGIAKHDANMNDSVAVNLLNDINYPT